MVQRHFLIFWLMLLAACGRTSFQPEAPLLKASDTVIETNSGDISGGLSENGARTWLGIPYAQPPVGDLRWRAPEAPKPWQEIRPALAHGNWCPQFTTGLDALFGIPKGELRGNEDCLVLDIYAPSSSTPSSQLPVMFWIHGGSNVWGRAEQYDGSVLAETENVVVVIVQYRLGPMGWFSHPSLQGEGANFALMDLVKALTWTQENIGAFGGDTKAVTIFGESAGANDVLALLAMEKADGLYRAAIAQSGLPSSIPLDIAQNGIPDKILGSVAAARTFTGSESPDSDALRSAALADIFEAYRDKRLAPIIRDGVTLAETPLPEAIGEHQHGRNIPIILGSNRDEAKLILAFSPEMTRKTWGLFPKPKNPTHYEATSAYMSRTRRIIGVTALASSLTEAGIGPIRTYRFDWDEQGSVGPTDFSTLIGAAHTMEIPFVFGRFDEFWGRLDKRLFNLNNKISRESLSRNMMACWGEIARNRYDKTRCRAWPVITTELPIQTLVFDASNDGSLQIEEDEETFADIISSIAEDKVLNVDGRRCALAQKLEATFYLVAPETTGARKELCDQAHAPVDLE